MKDRLIELLSAAVNQLREQGILDIDHIPPLKVERSRDPSHGDLASNIALVLARSANMSPLDLAHRIVDSMPGVDWLEKTEIAGPGFINFFLKSGPVSSIINQILEQGDTFGCNESGRGTRVLIEFVSANPTGPLHIGHGRGAAYGASLSSLLQANGYSVHNEYYVNDSGRQMDILAVSVWLRYLELAGVQLPFPASGYQGDYVWDIGATLHRENGDAFRHPAESVTADLPTDGPGDDGELYIDALISRCRSLLGEEHYRLVHQQGLTEVTANIARDLHEFGVQYDEWFAESSLMENHSIQGVINQLLESGNIEERDGALWFKSSTYGDEKDRVVQRHNGLHTYFASDIAYHINKLERGYDRLINIWGADHHGYIARVKAAMTALGAKPDQLEVMLVQFACLYEGGEQVRMSTRSGHFVTLRELRQNAGNDATRFFYVMRRPDQHLDFDIDLAKSRSNKNPVYYIQYAHARVSSVFRELKERGLHWNMEQGLNNLECLAEEQEQELIRVMCNYAELIANAGSRHEPHQITYYLRELAQALHSCYNAHQFIVDDERLRNARLCLIRAAQQIIRNGLRIIGVSAPDAMHRD